ncbi:MAG: cupin-like domain-containing protein [Thermomonas sp.]|uniref:cupin-like domain-containing protein n=1 Tax=Thermomonas sp. TaxID=1971895 RepID=UPI0039E2793A
MSARIDEYANGQPVDARAFALDEAVAMGKPLVIRGLCRDWPLVRAAQRSFSDFAQALVALDSGVPVDVLHMPPEAGGAVGYNAALDGFNYRHFKVSLTEALTRLAAYSRVADEVPGLALQSALLADCAPGFASAHAMQCLPASVQPRLWVGNKVTTPAHFDASQNIAVSICGRRRFTLFPVEQVANLYIGPLDFAPTGAAITMARPDAPDFERFPRLREALAHAQIAELEPGDALYLPPLWWHQVESLESLNALVNYWWSPLLADGLPPASGMEALLHARLAFAALPAAERQGWRALFDHYVFGDEDPAAHIPKPRRGVLDAPDAEGIARLRARVKPGA